MRTPLPPILESKLADFRKRVWVVKMLEGVLAGIVGVYLSWFVLFVLDRVMETPVWLRWTLMIGGTSVLAVGLPWKWHRWVWRLQRLEDAARLLRRTFPRLGDQLLGIVELARHDNAGRSERLVQAAMEQTTEAVKDRDLREAMPDRLVKKWTWAMVTLFVVFLTLDYAMPEASMNALARWLMPWKNIERFTFAKIENPPERLVVPFAEPFELKLRLSEDTRWSPQQAKARVAGQPVVVSALKDRTYALAFPPQKSDAELKLSLGDVRETVSVLPRLRPELTALGARTRLPAYLQYQTEPGVDARSGSISVLKGAQVALEGTASRELAGAQMNGRALAVSGEALKTPYEAVTEDTQKQLMWKDRDGLTPLEPLVLKIRSVQDEAPRLAARRETLEQVVLDSEVVVFDVDAQDDFGVRRVGLEWHGVNNEQTKGDRIAAAGAPEKRALAAKATFCASRDGVTPQTLEIRAWADDYLPERKRAYSAAFVLHVLNKTDHALWLTEQFGKWLESARESYEREQQLHATNQELRHLPAAELDRPENRRKIAQQASAESANAARLSSLNQSGRNLVSQATRNDEFDARRLESWATMLKSLQDIAKNRMPSVADLLKQSSGAQAGANSSGSKAKSAAGQAKAPASAQNKPSAPQIANGAELPKGSQDNKPATAEQKKENKPSIADREGSMTRTEPKKAEADAKSAPPPPSGMKLPTTQMAAAPSKKQEGGDEAKPAETQAQQKMDEALDEQKLLLAEFAKVSDELGAILASLEASTFVKRLKKASREQMVAAKDLNTKTLSAFGLERQPVKDAAAIAEHQKKQSEVVRVIQSDLEAYYARKPEMHFKNVIGQMKDTQVVKVLQYLGDQAAVNLSGSSLAGAEFWADTFDRWAEEMVAASECKACSSCSADSLPPEIVLKVMKALRDEMKLRDETRELENARPALKGTDHGRQAANLASKQFGIQASVRGAFDDIHHLPQGNDKFARELRLLGATMEVMMEAAGILDKADTGAPAIAAETEAIELLLQAKRQGSKAGGGGGSNPGGGGTAEAASEAALADLGEGADAETKAEARPVGQSTGKAGRELPEEFKTGLDAYFNKLEARDR